MHGLGFHNWAILDGAYNGIGTAVHTGGDLPMTGTNLALLVLVGALAIIAGLFIHALRSIDE